MHLYRMITIVAFYMFKKVLQYEECVQRAEYLKIGGLYSIFSSRKSQLMFQLNFELNFACPCKCEDFLPNSQVYHPINW